MITNATIQELDKAMITINKFYDNNIVFNRYEIKGNKIHFTIKCKDSKLSGHRIGFTGKRLINACYHVHGKLFDALFTINSNIHILARGNKITINEGNWNDCNIGSIMNPLYFSEACECE